jgi:hypothetical protein
MSDSDPNSVNNLDGAWSKQQNYAKTRLVMQLGMFHTHLIPGVLSNSLTSSLTHYTWSDEEQARIKKIALVLDNIQEHRNPLENLLMPLINTYWKQSLSLLTSMPEPTTTEGGDAPTSKPELPLPPVD